MKRAVTTSVAAVVLAFAGGIAVADEPDRFTADERPTVSGAPEQTATSDKAGKYTASTGTVRRPVDRIRDQS